MQGKGKKGWAGKEGERRVKLVSFLFLHSVDRMLGSATKVSGQEQWRLL
jgi:hypothetical protein